MANIKDIIQRGDTIVEVLVSMAVLGLVLASAFAISNRSYATGINAQERTEALKIAESQVELLRIASNSTQDSVLNADPLNPNRLYCIDPEGSTLVRVNFDDPSATVSDQGDLDTSIYPAKCSFGTDGRYYVSIDQSDDVDINGISQGGKIFSVRVYWESVFGSLSNVVNHEYRTYNFGESFSLVSPVVKCSALGATNIGSALPCVFPVLTCQDTAASNFNSPLPCTYSPANIRFVVKKIPPAAGITTPNCSSPATSDKAGTQLSLGGATPITTNALSTATFTNLSTNRGYSVSATAAPPGYGLCAPTTASTTTGAPGSTVVNNTFKIRPLCTSVISIPGNSYWAQGARQPAADGWYGPYFTGPTGIRFFDWRFMSTISSPPGTYFFYNSGVKNRAGTLAWFEAYTATYVTVPPVYTNTCPI